MSGRIRLDLLTNGSGTSAGQEWPGGDGLFMVSATFGGGNVALQILGPDAATWLPLNISDTATAISITAANSLHFRAPQGQIRAVATTATAVYASAVGIPAVQ